MRLCFDLSKKLSKHLVCETFCETLVRIIFDKPPFAPQNRLCKQTTPIRSHLGLGH